MQNNRKVVNLNDFYESIENNIEAVKEGFLIATDISFSYYHPLSRLDRWTKGKIQILQGLFPKAIALILPLVDLFCTLTTDQIQALGMTFPHIHMIDLPGQSLPPRSLTKDKIQEIKLAFPHITTLNLHYSSLLFRLTGNHIQTLGDALPHITTLNLFDKALYSCTGYQIQKIGLAFSKVAKLSLPNNDLYSWPDEKIQALGLAFSEVIEVNVSDNHLSQWTNQEMYDFLSIFSDLKSITIKDKNLPKRLQTILTDQLFNSDSELNRLELYNLDEELANKVQATAFQPKPSHHEKPDEKSHDGNIINIISGMINEMIEYGKLDQVWLNIFQGFSKDIGYTMDCYRSPISVITDDQTIPSFAKCVKSSELNKVNDKHNNNVTTIRHPSQALIDETDEKQIETKQSSTLTSPTS